MDNSERLSIQPESTDVDAFIQAKVLPQFHPVVTLIRSLMRECAPEAKEVISYSIPAFRIRHIIAVISPTKKDITLSFSKGASFEDPYHLLGGVGKVSKVVKIKRVEDANLEALRYYIRQAVERD